MSNHKQSIDLKINGKVLSLVLEPRVSLLDAIRDFANLKGTKKGCNQGACGACTILVDGERINSCLALAVQYQGVDIQTIESFAVDGRLHPLQQAFIAYDGFQCGYCTPGQICSAVGMIKELESGIPSVLPQSTLKDEELRLQVRERMSGNLCRCGAYNGIVDAIVQTIEDGEKVGTSA